VLVDRYQRPLRSLRLSVTDRCNLRCNYCMPEADYVWLPRQHLLSFEELSRIVDLALSVGVDKVRLTGGEPLLRRDLPVLIAELAAKAKPGKTRPGKAEAGLTDLALTTNGVLLAAQAAALKAAGLHRLTVSIDTLRPDTFKQLTRFDHHDAVIAGIRAAAEVFGALKLDTVVIRGTNDDEILPLLEFAREVRSEIRFIEYMDVGGATHWSPSLVVTRREMLDRIEARYGHAEPVVEDSSAPAARYRLADGTTFGIIASTTEPFCSTCDRSRLTADGMLYTCLYATHGTDLRGPLRAGASDDDLRALLGGVWSARQDRGAEDRLALANRGAFISADSLRRDAHLEMHTKGG
jgi:cyclic pyranopterin phosphate synthase